MGHRVRPLSAIGATYMAMHLRDDRGCVLVQKPSMSTENKNALAI